MLVQDVGGGVEILTRRNHRLEALVLDLADVDGRVPGGEQRRGADRFADFGRQGMHLILKHRLGVGAGIEIVVLCGSAQVLLQHLDQFVAIDLERIFLGPDLAHQFEPGVVSAGLRRQ